MKNKKIKFIQCFKVIEKELTWDLFIKYLNKHIEFCFYYKNQTIDIAFHYENQKKIYELNISDNNNSTHLVFNTINELVTYKGFDENKSIYDIWDDLET